MKTADATGIWSVGDITLYIKDLFADDVILNRLTVRGEISNFKLHHSGHCYFSLKDATASIRCVMFRSRAQQLAFEPVNGAQVLAAGHVAVYERDGGYQLYVDRMVEDGAGDLQAAFEALKEKLTREGLFDESRKVRLPLLPKAIGIVTSPTGAVVRDIFTVAKRRHPGIPLLVFPVAVQGTEAPAQIANAIRQLDAGRQVDVIIVGRGGGSAEELWAFNDERVIRAIAAAKTPIISAVGHQTDFTLADFAADVRAATPSQAAELAVPDLKTLLRRIAANEQRLLQSLQHSLARRRLRLERCMTSRLFRVPDVLIRDRILTVDRCRERLFEAMTGLLKDGRSRWLLATQKMDLLNPLAVLQRGYAIVRTAEGIVVRGVNQVQAGTELDVVVSDGRLGAVVTDVKGRSDGG